MNPKIDIETYAVLSWRWPLKRKLLMMSHVPPTVMQDAFSCPFCRAYAHQQWFGLGARPIPKDETAVDSLLNALSHQKVDGVFVFELKHGVTKMGLASSLASKCFNCDKVAIWVNGALCYPVLGDAPPANPDLPADIRIDYDEASSILERSPRGAAALIRLAIQKLCKELGEPGENINDDIGALVKRGLDPRVQKALDAVRVIGNSAVHPGKMDLRDDRATAMSLFKLINLIAEKTISEPKHVDEIYATLPEGALAAIQRRDQK